LTLAASTAELTLRMIVSLAVVGGVLGVVVRLSRSRLGSGRARPGIGVQARCQLTRASAVAVVRAGERYFLLGVNDQAVTILAEGDDLVEAELDEAAAEIVDVLAKDRREAADAETKGGAGRRHGRAGGPASSGMSVIEALREKTVRRR
jgi:flagellar biogenesis protein FliO